LDAITGVDPLDGTSKGTAFALPSLSKDVRGMRIGVCDAYLQAACGEVRAVIEKAMDTFRALGAEIVSVELPHLSVALPLYYILASAEASSNLGRYDGIRYGYRTDNYTSADDMICKTRSEGFGEEVRRRILLGTYVLSAGYYDAYYKKAQAMREAVRRDFAHAFEMCDVMLTPTTPQTAFPQGFAAADPVTTYQTDICTVPVNVAGLPAVSLPCGTDANGLPIGLQLIGKWFCEGDMLCAAKRFEDACGFVQCEQGVRV
jgi:aspartyl-tRNA(Asn)/glutamyl-tRNA(Gln) amidotransferase subunit A